MNNRIPAVTGAMFVVLAAGATSASADTVPCGQSEQSAVYETTVTPGTEPTYTQVKVIDVEGVPAVPAVPAVEEVSHIEHRLVTPATDGTPAVFEWVKVIDRAYVPAVPAVPAVYEDVKVIDVEAVPAVDGQHYSLKGNSGLDKDEVPPTPEEAPDLWQANTHDEPNGHYNSATDDDGTDYEPGESGLHFTSHGQYGEGKRDWFYFKAGTPAVEEVSHTEQRLVTPEVPGTPEVTELSHLEWQEVTPEVPGTDAVYEDVKVIDVAYVPEVPGTPAVEEVSHYEDVLVKEGTPATKSTVLVSEATPAGDPCAVPTSARFGGPSSLAQTGTDTVLLFGVGGALALAGAVLAGAAYRKNESA